MSRASHLSTGLLAPGGEDLSDAELISRVRGGDVDAYGDLFARHRGAAERLARHLVHGTDVDDLVSEAFTKVLNVLLGGGGPDVAFRAYLLTAVRRLHVDRIRAVNKATPTDDLEPYDAGVPFADTVIAGFEGSAAARAFASLPERWQLVLWHLEVEGNKPADVAPLLGMTPNSVSALAYRAREGLRQAFLQMHTAELAEDDCRWTRGKLGAYVRNGLSRRDSHKVDEHLDGCRRCTAIFLELGEINSELAGLIGPIVLGGAAAAYLAGGSASGAAAASTGLLGGLWDKPLGWLQGAVGGNAVAVAGGAAAVGVATVATLAVVVTQGPADVRTTTDPRRPAVTVPVAPPPSDARTRDRNAPPTEEPETPAIALSAEDGTTGAALPTSPPTNPLTAPILQPTAPAPAPDAVTPVEEPVTEEPAVEEPPVEEPVTEEPATDPGDQPAGEDPTDPGGSVDQPGTGGPGTDEPGTDEPGTGEPGTDEPPPDEEPAAALDVSFVVNGGNSQIASARLSAGLFGLLPQLLPVNVVLTLPPEVAGVFPPRNDQDCRPVNDRTLICPMGTDELRVVVRGLQDGDLIHVELQTPILGVTLPNLKVKLSGN